MTPTELENVERFRAGIFGGSIMAVAATDYDDLLTELRVTRRALELRCEYNGDAAIDHNFCYWISEARKELETE